MFLVKVKQDADPISSGEPYRYYWFCPLCDHKEYRNPSQGWVERGAIEHMIMEHFADKSRLTVNPEEVLDD